MSAGLSEIWLPWEPTYPEVILKEKILPVGFLLACDA
jgi:hypothetical protein